MSIGRVSAYPNSAEVLSVAATAQFLDGTTATMQPLGAATNATDGDATTHAQATNQWLWRLGLDLGATTTLNEIHVLLPSAAFATAFHVDSSTNGTTYGAIETVSTVGVGGDVQYVLPSPTSARYSHVVTDAPTGSGQRGGQMGITEVVVQ
jgi:hypothetical protein